MHVVPRNQVAYGMQLPIQSQPARFRAPWEADAGPDELVRLAQAADRAGLFYVGVCDHVSIPEDRATTMQTIWYDTIATLGMLAGVTERVRLLTHVWIASYRHPLISAKSFATLDHLSKGRLIIGLGAGHVVEEFAQLGVDFHRRGKLTDEAMDAMDVALREEFPTFSGETWSFSGGGARPRPVQQPRPPMWVGGSSPAAIRRAAVKGDGWLPQGTPRADMPAQIAELRRHRDEARGGDPMDIGTVCELLYVGDPTWNVGDNTIVGKGERIADSLREFVGMGVNHLQVRFKSRSCAEMEEQILAFGAEVAPHLQP
jgi:probable F420-dependent oxidoreductase